MQPQPRVIDSSDILQGDEEIVIAHGARRYRLRATRNGRLAMPGGSPALRRLGYLFAFSPVLLASYLAGLPIAAVLCVAFLPAAAPVFEVFFLPALVVSEHCGPYEHYCAWVFEHVSELSFLQ